MDSDYYWFLLYHDLGPEDDSERLRQDYARSRRKGKFEDIVRRKRRQKNSPGRYYASSIAGMYLNKRFVKGWRGVNPENP